MTKILIIGAAGQIPRFLIPKLLANGHKLVLFARNASQRLNHLQQDNVEIIDGDLKNRQQLMEAMKDVDIVYSNTLSNVEQAKPIVETIEDLKVNRLIVASVLDIYGEVVGEFAKWNRMMVGNGTPERASAAEVVENSAINYTILRLTWLYDQEGKKYEITHKGDPFLGAQVTRQAVAQLITDIINNPKMYSYESIGVNEPNTNYDKPSFY
ncbi:NAD(P)H-binding protein [Staphylococcus sp. SQ8-PEA]|uniref:NAD(P)H-binding protein n=1 Tax=Staphylococcus marylandisciuri TaxID=2981529 RepID=A0ABT2QQL7_9STAP|nr:NAD(P)H-binding protein [Staphylococcus marylandisciuri]MCU5746266.1 NAD(P)H-binding protein [Staphylococcus marylandisciuri]